MQKLAKFGTVIGAAVLLAGCQSSPFAGWGFAKSQSARAEAAPPKVIGAQLIEEGRTLLAEGRISAAVATFRLARLDASTAAQAENGLGVAYAKLGRADLADHYFRAAVARDPSDMRFTANLLRLQHDVMLASRRAAELRLAAAEMQVADAPAPRVAADQQVHRATRGVFAIHTRSDLGAAPQMAVVKRQPAAPKVADAAEPQPDAASEAKLALADKPQSKELVFPQ